jgi:hypothetical protein
VRNETLWEEITVTLKVIIEAQIKCWKLIAILNEGRNVTKLGDEVEDKGRLCVRGNY